MFKGKLIIEHVEGETVEREIEIREGEGLIFKIRNAKIADLGRLSEEIESFLNGERKFMVISGGDIDIIKIKTEEKADGE